MIKCGRSAVTRIDRSREKHQPQFMLEEKHTAEAQTQQTVVSYKILHAMKNEKQVFEKMYVKYCKAD